MARKQTGIVACVVVAAAAIGLAVEPVLRLPASDTLRAQIAARYPREAVRSWKPLWFMSTALRDAVVAWEDPGFYYHSGLSYRDILDSLAENLRQGRYARGGSTITQQVAKNLFLTREKTLRRKLQDAVLARRLETVLSKDEILEVYLNTAEWGDHVYGADAAARFYFDVSADRLDWAESALLAAILPNPHLFNPCIARGDARRRRDRVLDVLRLDGAITLAQHQTAAATLVTVSCSRAH